MNAYALTIAGFWGDFSRNSIFIRTTTMATATAIATLKDHFQIAINTRQEQQQLKLGT